MTLHVGVLSRDFVCQIGDRLVSVRPSRRRDQLKEWDTAANKNIVIRTAGLNAVASYTGLAYIGELPTDDWLASLVVGPLWPPMFPNQGRPVRFHHKFITLQMVVESIRSGISREFSQLTPTERQNGLTVMLNGFTWKRFRHEAAFHPRPFTIWISYSPRAPRHVLVSPTPRLWVMQGEWKLCHIGVNPGLHVADAVTELSARSELSDLDVELSLRDAFRAVHADPSISGVGDEFMAVTIYRSQRIRVCYLRTGDPQRSVPDEKAYTPWVISTNVVAPPMEYDHSTTFGINDWLEFANIPPLPSGPVRTMKSQVRREPPSPKK
jgi:hypothetical protein